MSTSQTFKKGVHDAAGRDSEEAAAALQCDAVQHKSVAHGRERERFAAACTRLVFHSAGVTLSMLRENVCGAHMRHHTNETFLKLK